MRKHKMMWLAVVSSVALLAAACNGDNGDVINGDDPCDADPFGCVEVAAGEPIVVGTLLVISGENASLGQDSQNGTVLALDFRDTPGEVLGHPVDFNHQDDGCSAEGGQTGASALAADPQVVGVIGTSCSSAALGVADTILSEQGITIISPSNTGPALTQPETHQEFYLRTAHNDKIQGAAVADFAYNEQGYRTAATIHDGSPYADGLQQVFSEVFSGMGGEITRQEAIDVGTTDMTPVLTDIAADNPDLLYYPIFIAEGGLITAQAQGVDGLNDLAGSDGMLTQDFVDAAGADNAEGVFLSGPDVTALARADFYEDEFLPAYEERFGEAPQSVFHAHSFDAMNILLDAIEQAALQEEDGSLRIPRTALKDAMYATQGFPGITGTMSCDENGDCQQQATIGVFVVEGGAISDDPVFSKEYTLAEL